ncbi:MAG: ribulokinase [Alistipes sp.]|nr:ribulokinase [Alistipes sp.]
MKDFVIGLDYGTDSARAVLVNAHTGEQIAEAVHNYTRWSRGEFCDALESRFRQHPLDYIEALKSVLHGVLDNNQDIAPYVRAISVDTTASTPCLTDENLQPLSLKEQYKDNPDAMFVLWKDHTGVAEAAAIEQACHNSQTDYTQVSGYHYSAECFWAKVMHLLGTNSDMRRDARSVIECSDFICATLTGTTDPKVARMGHCNAAQKMFWREDWGGFPPESFFEALDPALVPILRTLNANKYTCDKPYGKISSALAAELGLSCDVVIGCGNVDSHQGAIGAGVAYKRAMINLGTSGCCMFVIPSEVLGGRIIDGVFGQAESCIIPGLVGFEVGLSAFGDAYAWLRRTLAYPTVEILAKSEKIDPETRKTLVDEVLDNILVKLGEDAAKITPRLDAPFATDWFNGRRSPEPNQLLWGSLMGLKLSTTAPELYYAIVEATALAMKTIVDHLAERDIVFDSFIGVGGISQKSPFVMQMLADAIGKDIHVSECKQSCALGSAICASVVAGLYPTIEAAQQALCRPIIRTYSPNSERRELLQKRHELYRAAGKFTESLI